MTRHPSLFTYVFPDAVEGGRSKTITVVGEELEHREIEERMARYGATSCACYPPLAQDPVAAAAATVREVFTSSAAMEGNERAFDDALAAFEAAVRADAREEDEAFDASGQPLLRGRCDECGAACDNNTGDCTADPAHEVAS